MNRDKFLGKWDCANHSYLPLRDKAFKGPYGGNLMAHDHRIQLRWKGQFGANPNAP